MNGFELIISVVITLILAALGLLALVGAIFFNATHQYATFGVCALVTIVSLLELRIEWQKKNIDN